jgi:predicted aconitase with swiveling domain
MSNCCQFQNAGPLSISTPLSVEHSRFRHFILCFNGLFAINVYSTLIYGVLGLRLPGHSLIMSWGPNMLYAAMVALGCLELWSARSYSAIYRHRKIAWAVGAYIIMCLLMALQIPNNLIESGSPTVVLTGSLTWLLPVVAVFGLREENWNTIRGTVCWQSAIGCFCLLCAMPTIMEEVGQSNPLHQRLSLSDMGGGIVLQGVGLTYGGTYLLLSFCFLPVVWRVTALTTSGLFLWIGIICQFRSVVATVSAATFLGLVYIPLRARSTKLAVPTFQVAVSVLAVVLVVTAIELSSSLRDKFNAPYALVSDYAEAIARRGVVVSDVGLQSSISDRIQESVEAVKELNILQVIVGKGFGATWSGGTMYDERRDMLHLGIGHCVLHGGILLALFALLGPALTAAWVFLRSRSEVSVVCAALLCLAIAGAFISNMFAPSLNYLLLSLCLGGTLLHLQPKVPGPWAGA